ncbi:methionine adenosyltransferase 2 subunit beta-like isoform X1 [Camellia sinensis]|uniref:methionine adenosyltransferase 2 subunit beta-like isoform X1 n=1 Tax=Camellia sinensis TaxID=4442 RepID=UPI001036C53B|nr:methionine adenosyltransferase 2 subunit beta-like isoform X1 [Camellia sinensis]
MSKKKVLVVGGTGYLGQHLLQGLSETQARAQTTSPFCYDVAFTHHSSPPPSPLLEAIPNVLAFHVDLRTGNGFEAISQAFGQPHVVVNCAALSVPRACEMDPTAAMSINVPSALIKWLSTFKENITLLIHLSTDQVYEGVKSFYKEEDETVPVNVYGKSKMAAEQFISTNCLNFAILRSSIIIGPQTISPVPKSLPIQWMDGVLCKGDTVDFFHDEFRCPVYVKDLVTVILTLTNKWISEGKQMQLILNVGGPDRLSRVQMAEAVAHIRGYNTSSIKSVSASSVDRGVKSPTDISMDITKLMQTLDFSPIPFRDGVRLTLAAEAGS